MNFKEHLKRYLTDEFIDDLMRSFEKEDRHALLLNKRKMSEDELLFLYQSVKPHPIVKDAYIYDKNEYDLGKSVYHALGCFYLQDPSAMLPAYYLNANENDIVLDLCAAPGGKTIQSSFLMNNKGLIISNDISRQRCFNELENIERLGIGNVILANNDFSAISNKFINYFDKILLDAPCSGSGMFRKDIKMQNDWNYNKVLKFAAIQKELILMAYSMLKEGGYLMYSTCSYSYEEDEEVIDYLLKNSDAEIVEIGNRDKLYQDNNLPYGVHTFPNLFDGEGQYLCLIHKKGNIENSSKVESTDPIDKTIFIDEDLKTVKKFGDSLFACTSTTCVPKVLNIVRYGVKIGTYEKNRFTYDYHYSRFLNSFPNECELNIDETHRYLYGETISKDNEKGFVLLKHNKKTIAFGKSDGKIIKNYFPKGLRRHYK